MLHANGDTHFNDVRSHFPIQHDVETEDFEACGCFDMVGEAGPVVVP